MPTGKVLAVTDRNGGRFKLGNDWYGLSYAAVKAGAAFMPAKGDDIEFSTDAKGYVDVLALVGKGQSSVPGTSTAQSSASTALTATSVAATQATHAQTAGWVPPASIKASALQAAATLLANSDPAGDTLEHVAGSCVVVAQVFERYLTGMGQPVTGSAVLTQAAAVANGVPDLPF